MSTAPRSFVRSFIRVQQTHEETQFAKMMHDALKEEDKQKVKKMIRDEEANAGILRGTKSQRCGITF